MSLIYSPVNDPNLPCMQRESASSVKQRQKHVVIMGAGPAGLTAAYELVVHQQVGVTVLEKDPRYVGGISRTIEQNGYRFDIGGHRFFSKSTEIEDLWSEVMGNDLLVRPRLSRIVYKANILIIPSKPSMPCSILAPSRRFAVSPAMPKFASLPIDIPRASKTG